MASWGAGKKRALMRRRGTEGSRDTPSIMSPLLTRQPKAPQPSKDELRAAADAAIAEWRAKQSPSAD
jgi:hypothetical protein